MLLVVMHHSMHYTQFDTSHISVAIKFTRSVLYDFGALGNNLFILVSCYFLCDKVKFRFKSVLSFLAQCSVFSVVLYLICGCFLRSGLSPAGFVKALRGGVWWFANTYFIFILLSPFVAQMLTALSPKNHLLLIATLSLLWIGKPSAMGASSVRLELFNVYWFLYLLIVMSYVRKYSMRWTMNVRSSMILGVVACMILVCVKTLLFTNVLPGSFLHQLMKVISRFSYACIFVFAFALFCVCKNLKPVSVKWVNSIGATTFGIYLIHEYPAVRSLLWGRIFLMPANYDCVTYIFRLTWVSVVVLIGCAIMSCIYELYGRPYVNRVCVRLFERSGVE